MKKLYDLLDGSVTILKAVQSSEIREYVKMPSLKMADYTRYNRLIRGRYQIREAGFLKTEQSPKKKQNSRYNGYSAWQIEKWKEVCQ